MARGRDGLRSAAARACGLGARCVAYAVALFGGGCDGEVERLDVGQRISRAQAIRVRSQAAWRLRYPQRFGAVTVDPSGRARVLVGRAGADWNLAHDEFVREWPEDGRGWHVGHTEPPWPAPQ